MANKTEDDKLLSDAMLRAWCATQQETIMANGAADLMIVEALRARCTKMAEEIARLTTENKRLRETLERRVGSETPLDTLDRLAGLIRGIHNSEGDVTVEDWRVWVRDWTEKARAALAGKGE